VSFLRAVAAIIAGCAVALAALGFASQSSLADGPAFAQAMSAALADPQVNAEIKDAIRTEVSDGINSASQDGGVLGQIGSALGADAIAEQATKVVDTDVFVNAWDDWSLLLHQGLADYAYGRPNPSVTVSGNTIDVALEPLITPVVGTGIASRVAGAMNFLEQDPTLTITTDTNVEAMLAAVGRLVEYRWLLLAIGVVAGLFAALAGRRRWVWLAITLGVMAVMVAALALAATAIQRVPAGGDMPATGKAVMTALTQGWTTSLLLVCAGLAIGAAISGTIAAVATSDGVTGPDNPT
jgi:hypothetical protein